MGFRFSMQSLLRLRTTVEERELLALRASAAAVARARAELASIDTLLDENRIAQSLKSGDLSAAELRHASDCLKNLGLVRARVTKNLETLEQRHEAQRQRYRVARQQREVLECLREKQLAQWTSEESRRQQNAADELALLRRARSRDA